ncbi:MAG TPA: NAD-dependent epimerase/dehydratase family protein [Candidatus Paceibacterota bacterium]|nr:NAD-dependent epimerase/dehydratase family protein [Candidatus Paceibacterota bacterium]
MADKKTVVVTGGAGFVGSHLCERLVKDGHRVISLDNYFTGSRDNHVAGVEYREGHTKDIAKHIPETPDLIYHLGEYSRVAKSIEEPAVVWDLNMLGTFGVLEFWRQTNKTAPCKLLYAGSSTKMAMPRPEGTAGRDLSPYTWAKASNTELVRNYSHWYELPYSVAYFYNVYGPREQAGEYGTVIEIFRRKRLLGEPLSVRSPGTQERIYTHVEDTVDGIVLIAEKGDNDEYSVAAKESYPILKVAQMFGGEIEMLPARSTSRPAAAIDTDTAKIAAFGWQQKHELADYINETKSNKPA